MSTVIEPRRVTPGMYPGLTRAEYDAIDAINVSSLQYCERSALHVREHMLNPTEPTDSMELGTAFHCAVLEPMRFAKDYIVAPKFDKRTNDGKAGYAKFVAEHPNAILLSQDDYDKASAMRDAVWSNPIAAAMLGGTGHNEVGVVWQHSEHGLLCKSLIDRITAYNGWSWIIDLKSTKDASRFAFKSQIRKLHYGAKAAFYVDGCYSVAPADRRFAWIAVESAAPYAVKVYEADDSALYAGRVKYQRWLYNYAEAKRTGIWSGYDESIEPLTDKDTEWYA